LQSHDIWQGERSTEGKDQFFGYVQDISGGVYVQEIDYGSGERVTGIAVVREDPEEIRGY